MAAGRLSQENDHLPAACQGCRKTNTPVYLRATMAAENLSREEETQHGPLTSVTPEEETQKNKLANTRACVRACVVGLAQSCVQP